MADYQNKISILLAAQDEASAVMQSAADSVVDAQERIAAATEDMADQVTDATEKAEAAFVSLGESTQDLNANLAAIAASTGDAVGGITILGDATEGTADVVIDANDAMIASYRDVSVAAIESGASQDASGVGTDVAKGALGTGGLAGVISNPYVLAGAAIAAATVIVVKSAADFQQAVTRIYTTAGETAPLQQLDSSLLQLARQTGESTTELTNGLYVVSSAGYNAASGLQVLRAAAEGARAENADLGTVTNALTTIMHDYGQGTGSATSDMNQMITAVSAGKMNLQDFAGSLSTVLPIAHSVGISFAQIAGAEATLTAGGVAADQATQDLHAVISTIIAPTTAQVTAMQQMGLSSVQLSTTLGSSGLTGVLNQMFQAITDHIGPNGLVLQSAFKNATLQTQDFNEEVSKSPPQLQELAQELLNGTISFVNFRTQVQELPEGMTNLGKQIEGTYNQMNSFNSQLVAGANASPTFTAELKAMTGQTNSMNAILMLTGANQAIFDNNVRKISASAQEGGTNIAEWSTVQKNFNQVLSELKETVITAAIALGEKLLPVLTELVRDLNDLVGPMLDFINSNSEARDMIVDLVEIGVMPLIAALTLLRAGFDLVKAAVNDVESPFESMRTSVSDTTGVFHDLDRVIDIFANAFTSRIAKLAGLVEPYWLAVRSDARDAFEGIGDDMEDALDKLGGDVETGSFGHARGNLQSYWVGLVNDAKDNFEEMRHSVGSVMNDLMDDLITSAGRLHQTLLPYYVTIKMDILAEWEDLKSKSVASFEGMKDSLAPVLASLRSSIHDAFDDVKSDPADMFKDLDDGTILTVLQTKGRAWAQTLTDAYKRGMLDLIHYDVTSEINWAKSAQRFLQEGLTFGETLVTGVVSGLTKNVHSIGQFFTNLPGLIESQLDLAGRATADKHIAGMESEFTSASKMKNLGDAILKGIGMAVLAVLAALALVAISIGVAIINSIVQGIEQNAHLVEDAILGLWNGLQKAFNVLGGEIHQWADDAVDDIVDAFTQLPGKIGSALTGGGASFVKDIGHDLHIPGFASGTSYAPGGLAVINEEGPEIVNLPQGSSVLTAAETRGALSGSGAKVVIQNLNINNNVDPGLVMREIGWQLANAT
jgi:hypothetical protein